MSSKKKAKQKSVARIRRRQAQKRQRRIAGRREFRDPIPVDILDGSASGLPKASELILAYASPLLDDAQTEEEMSSGIALAIMAWNASFLPDDGWRQSLQESNGGLPPSDDEWRDLEHLFAAMVDLKRIFFADEARMILDYELTFEGGDASLFVVSTIVEGPPEQEVDHPPVEISQSQQLSLVLGAS